MNRPIVVFDTETATNHLPPHLIEIGAVRVVDGEVVDHFESLVCPQVPIDARSREVHGISDEMVRDAPGTAEVLARFSAWVGADWLVAHAASFDATTLAFEYARYDLTPPPGPIVDALKIARRCIGDAPDHKLETLCQHLDIEADVHHRALADAVSCWKVLEACLERLAERRPATREADDVAQEDAQGSIAPLSSLPATPWSQLLHEGGALLSIAGSRPKPPKLSPRLRALEEACRARRRITLHYGEGHECSRLAVHARLLFQSDGKGYLEAECERAGTLKTYRLDRIQKVLE
jgi:DNA polymerase III epsilon subunit family exonuclease